MSILDLIRQHESSLRQSINLIASENLISADVKRALSSDVSMRYCIPPANERPAAIWDYPNQEQVRSIMAETENLARQLFKADYADSRPLSGNQIAQIILSSLVSKGDTVWSVPPECGGHFATPVIAAYTGLNLVSIPYDVRQGIIDVDAAAELAKRAPPKLIFLDASMQVFPHPLADLRAAVGDSAIISYDASHSFGLIAGGAFQSPLQEGADLLHGSTHKTLWGPQKGLITARENGFLAKQIKDAVVPLFVSNAHVHHIAALGIALEESVKFGPAYATAVILNAKELAAGLIEHGADVLFAEIGATESHQVLIDLGSKQKSLETWNCLQSQGLNTNAIGLPFRNSFGLRIGVAEATRRGLGPEQMREIARWIAICIKTPEKAKGVARNIAEMSERFSFIHFSNHATPIV